MVPLGRYFKDHGDLKPILFFLLTDRNRDFDLGEIDYDYVIGNQAPKGKFETPKKSSPISKKTWRVLSLGARNDITYAAWPLTQLIYVRQLRQAFTRAQDLFDRYHPGALVLPDDRSYQLLPYIKAARERGVPTMVVPVSFSNQTGVSIRRENQKAHMASGSHSPLVNRMVAKKYPDQVHTYHGQHLLFYAGLHTLALATCAMLPQNPWVLGGGDADSLLVDGFDARHQAIGLGVKPEKIYVSGHISHDDMFARFSQKESIREGLVEKYNLDPGKKLIVCAVPHLAEHGMISWTKHWQDVEALVGILAGSGHNILLSLHPKSNIQQYRYLEGKYPCRIVDENLDEIIVAAWLFVAGYSSTVRWAALSGIPAIVIDFNTLGYDLFDSWDGVIKVYQPQELQVSLERVIREGAYYQKLIEEQNRTSQQLTLFDGKAHQRIIRFVEKSISVGAGTMDHVPPVI